MSAIQPNSERTKTSLRGAVTLRGIILVALLSYAVSAGIAYLLVHLKEPVQPEQAQLATPGDNIRQSVRAPEAETALPIIGSDAPVFSDADKSFLSPGESKSEFVIRDEDEGDFDKPTDHAPATAVEPIVETEPAPPAPEQIPPSALKNEPAPAPKPTPLPVKPKAAPVSEAVTITEPTAPVPTLDETGHKLLQTFQRAYKDGDLRSLAKILDIDVKSNESVGKDDLLNEYRKLFDITESRDIRFVDMGWFGTAQEFVGQGLFEITLRHVGKARETRYEGRVFMQARVQHGMPLIAEMNYNYKK